MNILIINWRDILHPKANGAESYLHDQAVIWKKLGNSVCWLSAGFKGCKPEEKINGINVFRVGGVFSVYFLVPFFYFFRLRKKNFDIVIDAENGIPFFTPLFVRVPKIALMFHVHRKVFARELFVPLRQIAWFCERILMPVVYRNVRFVAISNSTKSDMRESGFSSNRIDIVFPGIALDTFFKGNPKRLNAVVYLGRLKKYKSVEVLLKAASIVVSKKPGALFWIVGEGDNRDSLERLSSGLGISKNVSFFGKVSEKKKILLLKKAMVFVNPSFKEGWAITCIESMACGTPVVASNVRALNETVSDKKTGLLFEYGNEKQLSEKILFLLENNSAWKALSKNGKKNALQYEINKTAQKFFQLMENVAGNHN